MPITTQPARQVTGRSGERSLIQQDCTPPTAPTQAPTLWPHQLAAVAVTHEAIRRGTDRGLWSMPTGCGKTVAFTTLARDLNLPTLTLVNRDELVSQTVNTLSDVWPDATVGVIKAKRDEWRGDEKVVVASIQSLHNGRLTRMPRDRFEFVIADEAHHAIAPSWQAAIDHFQHRFLLGVTATPERLDGEGLAELFGPRPLYSYALRQAIKDGVLVPIRQYCATTCASLDGVSTRAGDFAVGELSLAANTPARNKIVVNAYRLHAADRRAVAFAVDVEHAEALAAQFQAADITAAVVTGTTPIDERRETLAAFRRGDIRVLCNCQVLVEGWDDRGVSAVLMARPTKSRGLYTQSIGRSLRRCDEEGKADAIIIDFSDNAIRHKLVSVLDLFGSTDKRDAGGEDVIDVVDREVAEQEQQRRIETITPVSWRLERVSPWPEMPTLRGYVPSAPWHRDPASKKQVGYLRHFGLDVERDLTKGEASFLIDRSSEFRAAYPAPATPKQRWFLRKCKRWVDGMSLDEASKVISELKGGNGH